MKTYLYLFAVVIGMFYANVANAAKLHEKLDWNKDARSVTVADDEFKLRPYFEGAEYLSDLDHLPVFYRNIPLDGEGEVEVSITNTTYEQFDSDLQKIKSGKIKEDLEIHYVKGYLKKQPILTLYFVPIRKNGETDLLEKLVEFDVEVNVTISGQRSQAKKMQGYASESVLNNGNWYKIAVYRDGLHKVTYNFLKDLGINVDNIDPRNIRIYGNGGGMLPEDNSIFRHDDLVENPIYVSGENDGKFNQNDYLLFYGQGPHQWSYSTSDNRFHHAYNIYSDSTYYFITTDLGAGKRWSTQPSSPTSNTTVTTYDDFAFHEEENENFIESGREWYGEKFSSNKTAWSFSFLFPNLVESEPGYIKSRFAAKSTTSASSFRAIVNGQQVFTKSVSAVCASYTCAFASDSQEFGTFTSQNDQVGVQMQFSNPSTLAEGWLSYIELNVRRSLIYSGINLLFRDAKSVGTGNKSQFIIKNASSDIQILDVTNPVNCKVQESVFDAGTGEVKFIAATDSLREFYAYNTRGSFFTPKAVGRVGNQNLHGIGQPEMIIIVHPSLWNEAETLAEHHRTRNNLTVETVNVLHIYNEFSSGAQDLSAIRDFVKMIYDRASDPASAPKYLLLFGDASYDYKDRINNNNNLVPAYQSYNSTSPVSSFVTDDFFGFLDETEGGNITATGQYMDISIGRLPASNVQEARNLVNKIIHYQTTQTFGSWRNTLCFVGDDEDNNLHLKQSNGLAKYFEDNHLDYNIDKIFLDAYPQESTPGGNRYPDVKDAINKRMYSGALVMNYTGHGGVSGWAHERVLDNDDINSWENFDNMPLFITATCEFSKFDDPERVSSGELVLLNPDGGAIAMVTTVRLVYANANEILNNNFLRKAFVPYNDRMPTIGESIMLTKNAIPQDANNRKFVLLGDPAVTLAYPKYEVFTTSINGLADDTLKALKHITIEGVVNDNSGSLASGFNGTVCPTIFDKSTQVTTLKNDDTSPVTHFDLQKNVIYKGKASVNAGRFSFSFTVPKDISYNFGEGKISYYAEDIINEVDANGYDIMTIGGTADVFEADNRGPEIELFMNDTFFVYGGITDENPILLVHLKDDSGINTVGTGIGHDITAVLDADSRNTFVLNDFYTAELDNFTSGKVKYPLSNLEEGIHSIKVKAWDVHNNSAEGIIEFVVVKKAGGRGITLNRVSNYPNPFTSNTTFQFEHDRPGENLSVEIKIISVSGQVVETLKKEVISEGYRVDGIEWDGSRLSKGVYIYGLYVKTPDGSSANKFEKLVILK